MSRNSPFLYISNRCNNNCVFCSEADNVIPEKTLRELQSEIRQKRKVVTHLNVMGKEPTLRKDLFEILRYIQKCRFEHFGLTTNGRMCSYPDFARELLRTGITQLVVSISGHCSALHDAQTMAPGSFQQTIQGIQNVLKLKDRRMSLLVNVTVNRATYLHLPAICDMLVALGVEEINFLNIEPVSSRALSSKMLVSMSDAAPYLIRAVKSHPNKKFLFVNFLPCILPTAYRKYFFPCLEQNSHRKYLPFCKGCGYQDRCAGILGAYRDMFGDAEFRKAFSCDQ